MRGHDSQTEAIFAYVTPESFVPKTHPLRAIRAMIRPRIIGTASSTIPELRRRPTMSTSTVKRRNKDLAGR